MATRPAKVGFWLFCFQTDRTINRNLLNNKYLKISWSKYSRSLTWNLCPHLTVVSESVPAVSGSSLCFSGCTKILNFAYFLNKKSMLKFDWFLIILPYAYKHNLCIYILLYVYKYLCIYTKILEVANPSAVSIKSTCSEPTKQNPAFLSWGKTPPKTQTTLKPSSKSIRPA